MTSNVLSSSGFSFRRVWAYASYYMPRLKWELLIYAGISLICAILCLIPAIDDVQMIFFVGAWTVLPILFYCGPLIFATGPDTRIINRLIPVSAAEKMVFYYTYILIVVPVVVFLLPLISAWIYMSCPALQTEKLLMLYQTKFNSWGILFLINIVGGMFVVQACFWSVEHFQHNRMLMGIVAVIVANIFMGILGGIIGIAAAIKGFRKGFMEGLNGNPANAEACAQEFLDNVMTDLTVVHPLSITILGVIVVLVCVTGWQTYHSLRYRNL